MCKCLILQILSAHLRQSISCLVEGDKNGAQLVAKGFQELKEVPSDSYTVDEGVLLIATRNCWSLKLCDWQIHL